MQPPLHDLPNERLIDGLPTPVLIGCLLLCAAIVAGVHLYAGTPWTFVAMGVTALLVPPLTYVLVHVRTLVRPQLLHVHAALAASRRPHAPKEEHDR